MNKIDTAIHYYTEKEQAILNEANSRTDLTAEDLIRFGEEMAILEYKMTALEVAKEN